METRMLLAVASRGAFGVAGALMLTRAAIAAELAPTKAECIAASESGQDLRHAGRLRDARTDFVLCAAGSCPGPIRNDCLEHLVEIARATPSIMFEFKDTEGHDVAGVTMVVDGNPAIAAVRTPIEVDPGEHNFTFEAFGRPKAWRRLVLAEGVKRRREVITFADAIEERAGATRSAGISEPARSVFPPSNSQSSAFSTGPPALAWAAFGVGAAGLLLGIGGGFVAGGKHSTLEGECDNETGTCAPRYAGDLDAFHTWRTVSTVGYVVGALGVASGAAIWFTAPKTSSSATAVRGGIGPLSAGLMGRF